VEEVVRTWKAEETITYQVNYKIEIQRKDQYCQTWVRQRPKVLLNLKKEVMKYRRLWRRLGGEGFPRRRRGVEFCVLHLVIWHHKLINQILSKAIYPPSWFCGNYNCSKDKWNWNWDEKLCNLTYFISRFYVWRRGGGDGGGVRLYRPLHTTVLKAKKSESNFIFVFHAGYECVQRKNQTCT
jgi:hypothetical protein